MAKAAAESVDSGVGVRRGIAKVGHKWGNFVLSWWGWQTVGSAPYEARFRVCEQARRVFYGAVFRAKKEIPAEPQVQAYAVRRPNEELDRNAASV